MIDPEIICTIGPSCNSKEKLLLLKEAGVDIVRVNMSHASISELANYFKLAKSINLNLGLDTEGAQLRSKISSSGTISIKNGDKLNIYNKIKPHLSSKHIALYPSSFFSLMSKGLLIRLDFNGVLVEIEEIENDYLKCKCINGGIISNNKGCDVINQLIELPDFTDLDIKALKEANNLGITEIFLSFCKSKEAILKVQSIVQNSRITSKIENKLSIHNLREICTYSDSILIDRGDLSREINIMDLPFAQRGIIKVANESSTPCYVATNVLESLINGNLPTRAELNDIVSTIEMGAKGIVLAAETAIGNKPILCVEIVKELIHRFRLHNSGLLFADIERNEITDSEMRIWLNRGL